jgi:hypothetical protein
MGVAAIPPNINDDPINLRRFTIYLQLFARPKSTLMTTGMSLVAIFRASFASRLISQTGRRQNQKSAGAQ